MTLDIANRLIELRKKHGYSQEKLAEMLGLSRQAVSKWERAEASPDTDNLILLSRLYGVSMDELLNSMEDDAAFVKDNANVEEERNAEKQYADDYVSIGKKGIHVEAKNGDVVHVGWDGIHVNEGGGKRVRVDRDGVFVDDGYDQYINRRGKVVINGVAYSKRELRKKYFWLRMPYAIAAMVAVIVLSFMMGTAHPAWLLLLTIPVMESFIRAIIYRNAHIFAFPLVALIVYLCLGFFMNLWHPGWVVFLTIPIYYSMIPKYSYDRHCESCDADQAADN